MHKSCDKCSKVCGWEINSPEHDNCFWDWVRAHSNKEGEMNPIPQSLMMQLLGSSPSAASKTINKAIAEINAILRESDSTSS